MTRKIQLTAMLILIPVMSIASSSHRYKPITNQPLISGNEIVIAPVAFPPYPSAATRGMDVIGDTTLIGTDWWDSQHNGTIGRMIEKSSDGYLHFAWTNGLNYGATQRHIYYNYITPAGTQGWPGTGYPVESASRAGYNTLDVDSDGRAFPCFHWTNTPGGDFSTATALDFFPHIGSFISFQAPAVTGVPEVIWPRMQFDNQQKLQIVSTENPASGAAGSPQRHFYTRGTFNSMTYSITYDPFEEITWTMTIAADVATSEASDRIAVAWTYCRDEGFPAPSGSYSQRNNDVYYLIDEDGVDPDWNQAVNLTNFIPPDLSWLPDSLMADMDTLRAYTDISAFFDHNDYLHLAFTTPSYFELEGTAYWHASIIWHWSEQFPEDFVMIHNAFDDFDWNFIDCGGWNVKAQRPSLAENPVTGDLYCAYQVYDVDTAAISAGGYPSGEVYISVSQDGGMNWAVGTNITNTITPQTAAPGLSLSETYPTMAKLVDGDCHIMYVLDRDAGCVQQTEGTWTLNDVIYHQIAESEIATSPLVEQNVPFHVEHSTVAVEPNKINQGMAQEIGLSQNYPNPFNPSTTIRFNLPGATDVRLAVYNIAGRMVRLLVDERRDAGIHDVSLNADDLTTGLYIYRLETERFQESRKMMIIK